MVYQYFDKWIIYACIIGDLYGSKSHSYREDKPDEKNSIDFRNYFSGFNIYRWWIYPYKSWASKCRICSRARDLDYDMLDIAGTENKTNFNKVNV